MRVLAIFLLTLAFVAGCGGGDGSGSSSSSSSSSGGAADPTPTQTTQASNAKVQILVSGATTNNVRLDWDDTVNESTGYTIEQLTAGSWTVIATVGRPAGRATTVSWTGTVTLPATLRIRATLSGHSVILSTAANVQQLSAEMPASFPSIVLDQAEPLHDRLGVSIVNPAGTFVTYTLDGTVVDANAAAPLFGPGLGFSRLPVGAHVVGARFRLSLDRVIEVQRTVQVRAGDISPFFAGASDVNIGQKILLSAQPRSDFGIQQVQFFLDGRSLQTISAPNYGSDEYHINVDARAIGSGSHSLGVVATAGNGIVGVASSIFNVRNPPLVTITSPSNGMLAIGTIRVSGTMMSDVVGASSRLSVRLDNVPIQEITASTFSFDVNLASLAPGSRALLFTATDGVTSAHRQLSIYVTAMPALVRAPVVNLPTGAQILAMDSAPLTVVAHTPDAPGYNVFSSGGIRRTLDYSGDEIYSDTNWQVAQGHVFTIGRLPAGASRTMHLLHWPPTGPRIDAFDIGARVSGVHAVVWPWVLAGASSNGIGQPFFTFYNAATAEVVSPSLPAPQTGFESGSGPVAIHNFHVAPGGLVLYYSSHADLSLHRWTQATNTDEVISGTYGASWPQTDGVNVAWESRVPEPALDVINVATGTRTRLSSSLVPHQWYVENGLIAWKESSPNASAIKVTDGTTTITPSMRQSSVLHGVGRDFAVYVDESKLYATRMAGAPRLLLDFVPDSVHVSGDTVLFTLGGSAIYAVQPD